MLCGFSFIVIIVIICFNIIFIITTIVSIVIIIIIIIILNLVNNVLKKIKKVSFTLGKFSVARSNRDVTQCLFRTYNRIKSVTESEEIRDKSVSHKTSPD